MVRPSFLPRFLILSVLGPVLASAGGCGSNPTYEGQEQQSSANQQAARTAAYGNPNNPAANKKSSRPALSPEAAARAKGGR